jgi:rhamnose utilization protein RhaD (predicted bifunctional aldolase and dehydrogenase)
MEDFIKVSQTLGKNILYVQGAGGNSSIKVGDKLYVKASGEKLKNMTATQG